MDAQFGSAHPTQKQIDGAKALLKSQNYQYSMKGLQSEMADMTKRRIIAERLVANILDFRKSNTADEGSTAYLYCNAASQLAMATYEEQQD